ncbi:MAP2K4 isoform 6 [Pan troglodytes]|uniref:Mitogen-activated protein kinase kinase 4 n=3 Tax=Hominidae TaxID=9604 RepID=J3QLE2_HUMAN|nr:MAP2K4 isoform 2 [Pan troglodytes]PNI58779.1 MAP2K4 isoform 6 [Pan troglodytes]PNJ31660.1 MAP2K4 isoform 6 [Pongo abelii]PNJ31665.1 MAP2K4 isoform 14 [Pongo abelii]
MAAPSPSGGGGSGGGSGSGTPGPVGSPAPGHPAVSSMQENSVNSG